MSHRSNVAPPITKNWHHCRSPIPPAAIYILLALFLLGLCVSAFFLIVIHNALFFVLLLCISTLLAAFVLWNTRNAALALFLHSFPDSDLSSATHGHLVKITGAVSCGDVSLESSYEKISPCVYTSTLLYEYRELCLKPSNVRDLCVLWRLAYSERLSTDFYITDMKSGIRALVKAGPGSKVIPLIIESRLIKTSYRTCRVLSSNFRKWLREREISAQARLLCLQEGYIKEGSCASVVGVLHKNNDVLVIVEPQEIVSTGCLWPKLLFPVEVEGLIIGIPRRATLPPQKMEALHIANETKDCRDK
ncbi:UNVERIFIED_CONTAM: putative membrane protein [Sesamum radiatum]|uniref:Membrane protein n=1 Tax=Sesamum radiatum TaxID=300843 RepID=A0AAW2VHE0_SESRA